MSDEQLNPELEFLNDNGILAATVTDVLSTKGNETNLKLSLPVSSGINAPVLLTLDNVVQVNCGDDILIPNANVRQLLINRDGNLKKVFKAKIGKSSEKENSVIWNEIMKKFLRLTASGVNGIYMNNNFVVVKRQNGPKLPESEKVSFFNGLEIIPAIKDKDEEKYKSTNFDRTLDWMATRFQELEGMMGDTHLTNPIRPVKFDFENSGVNDDNREIVKRMIDASTTESRKGIMDDDYDILMPGFYFGINKDRDQVSSIVSEIRQGGQKSITPSGLERNVLSPRYVQFSSVKDNPLTFWQQANRTISQDFFPSKFMSSEGCTRFLTLHELGHSIQRGFGIKPSYIETIKKDDGSLVQHKSQTFDADRHREEIFADCFAIISMIVDFNDKTTPSLVRQLRATQMFNAETNLQTVYYMTAPAIAEAIEKAEKLVKTTKKGEKVSMYEIGNMAADLAQKWHDTLQEPMNEFFEENDTQTINPRKSAWESFLKKARWDDVLDPHFAEFKIALANLYGASDLSKKENMENFQKELGNLVKDVEKYGIENRLPIGERAFWLLVSTEIPNDCSQEVKEKIQEALQGSFIKGVEYTKKHPDPQIQPSGWVAPSSFAFSEPAKIPILPKKKAEFENEKRTLSLFKENMSMLSKHMEIVNKIAPDLYDGKKKNGFELTEMNRKFNYSTHYVMALASDLYMTFERAEELGMTFSDMMSDKAMLEIYEILPILIDLRAVMGKHENNEEGRGFRIRFANIFNDSVKNADSVIQNIDRIFIPEDELSPPSINVNDLRSTPYPQSEISL